MGSGKGGDFISAPVQRSRLRLLDVVPALQAAIKRNAAAGLTVCEAAGCAPPENAGQIITALILPGDSQHHIADLPAQGRFAERGGLTDGPYQMDLIFRRRVTGLQTGSIQKYQQPPGAVTVHIVGAKGPGHPEHTAAGEVLCLQKGLGGDHWQRVYGPGEPGDLQGKAEVAPSAIFMGELGLVLQFTAE